MHFVKVCVCVALVLVVVHIQLRGCQTRGLTVQRREENELTTVVASTQRIQQEHSAILGTAVYTNVLSNADILGVIPKPWTFVNIGANDGCVAKGVSCDEANNLLDEGAFGWLVDGDSLDAVSGYYKGKSFQAIGNYIVTTNNVLDLLRGVPLNLSFVKVDIDRNDCQIMFQILSAGYRPSAVQMEYNPLFPPPVLYNWPHADWPSSPPQIFNECSLQYLTDMMRVFGYSLLQVDMWDAWFGLGNFTAHSPAEWWARSFIYEYPKARSILERSAFASRLNLFHEMLIGGLDTTDATFAETAQMISEAVDRKQYPFLHALKK